MNKDTENMPVFQDIPLELYSPEWGSELASTIIELEKLRVKKLGGPVPAHIFFQLKEIFQMFESLGSARIEGNKTTLSEFVEKVIENPSKITKDESLREIFNIDNAIEFIEKNVTSTTNLNRAILSEVHTLLVDGLTPPPSGEGSRYPGVLRPIPVTIQKSNHLPPEPVQVPEYFEKLIEFVNDDSKIQDHLLVTAIAHHRMAWIHPFDNGNGRMVRMFTYAMLIKQGFQVKSGRILNPTAIFCMDRDKYYEMLGVADKGGKIATLVWCAYVLEGLKYEIEKIDKLLDLTFMTGEILIPALDFSLKNSYISSKEYDILKTVVRSKDMKIRSADIVTVKEESPVQRSRIIKRLRDKNMLTPVSGEKGRIYSINFVGNYLLRGIAHVLQENNFIPKSLNQTQ